MASSTILRVKRKIEDNPQDALVLLCKRAKTDTDEISPSLFVFQGTVDNQENNGVKNLVPKTDFKLKTAGNISHIIQKIRDEKKEAAQESRYKVVNCSRGLKDDEDDSENVYDLVDLQKASDEEKDVQYAYDLYVSAKQQDFDVSMLDNLVSIENYEASLIFGSHRDNGLNPSSDDEADDDDDSNDENNWRNEYPDTDNSSIDEEDMIQAMKKCDIGQSCGDRRAARGARRGYAQYKERRPLEGWLYEEQTYDPRRELNRKPTQRSQSQSSGNRRGAREAQQCYAHYNERRQLEGWLYQPQTYDPRREHNRKPTQRSQGQAGGNRRAARKSQQSQNYKQAKTSQPKRLEQTDVPSTEEDPLRDEPFYDIGPYSSLIPVCDMYCQNFDFAGFIPLVNQTYDQLGRVDPRLAIRLPLSMFTHAMTTHLNFEILETARKAGQNDLNQQTDVREILPDYQVIPKPIVDYLSHVSSTTTQDGMEIVLNLPTIAIPQGPVIVDNVQVAESGSFGMVNAANHNVYEAYISPLVTSNRVLASQNNDITYAPLPKALIPGNLIPNRNLLGYEAVDPQNNEAQSRLAGIVFPNDDTLEGRYRYSALLQTRVYIVLAEMNE